MAIKKIRRKGKPSVKALDTIANRFTKIMQADIKGQVVGFTNQVDYDKVKDAVYSGDWTKVFAAVQDGFAPEKMGGAIVPGLEGAIGDAASHEASQLRDLAMDADLAQSVQNLRLQRYIRERTGALIQNVTDNIQQNVQTAVTEGLRDFKSPSQIAQRIRDNLPLDVRRQGALDKYKASLAATKMTKPRQQELSDKFRNALTDERALTIARTESQYALNAGQKVVWEAAAEKGYIGQNSLKVWYTEAEPCPICRPMNNKKVRIYDKFILPNGVAVDQPPAHVNCRCNCALEPKD